MWSFLWFGWSRFSNFCWWQYSIFLFIRHDICSWIFDWFTKNFLKGNADKCHLISSSKTPVENEVSNITVTSEEKLKLSGIILVNSAKKDWEKIACSNSNFQIREHFSTQTNCRCFYNVLVLVLSFNLNVS